MVANMSGDNGPFTRRRASIRPRLALDYRALVRNTGHTASIAHVFLPFLASLRTYYSCRIVAYTRHNFTDIPSPDCCAAAVDDRLGTMPTKSSSEAVLPTATIVSPAQRRKGITWRARGFCSQGYAVKLQWICFGVLPWFSFGEMFMSDQRRSMSPAARRCLT